MMQEPIIRHSYVEIHSSLVHLVQYGLEENLLKPPYTSSSSSPSIPRSSLKDKNSRLRISTETHVLKQTSSSSRDHSKRFVVFIPGNPGILGMYHDFLLLLYKTLNGPYGDQKRPNLPILALSHNNFDHPEYVNHPTDARYHIGEDDVNFAEKALASNYKADPHRVELQVLNKLIILKRLLKMNLENYRIIFIGHSIGCYVIMKLLQDKMIDSVHIGSILLHPALENLALTSKGALFNRLFSYRMDLFMRLGALVVEKLLPKPIKLAITRWKCTQKFLDNSSDIALESLAQLACSGSLKATIEMAKSEFSSIKDLDIETLIKPQASKLKLIYAINDHWVNTEHRQKMKQICPDLYIEEQSVLHAFIMNPDTVMDYSVKVAIFIRDYLNDYKN